MTKFNEEWTVGPHRPLRVVDEGLLTVAADIRMPLGNFPRRMTVVALSGGRVAIWSAIPLGEPEMARIEALGRIAFLIVPGIGHRLDVAAWKKRYPDAQVLCARGARAAVEEAVPVDATSDVLDDKAVSFETVAGTSHREAALIVRRPAGTTLVLNDILANVRHPNGLGAKVMARLLGFGVERPQMPWVGKRMFVDDKPALARDFRRWAKLPNLRQIIVSHGDVIGYPPAEHLERIADELDRGGTS